MFTVEKFINQHILPIVIKSQGAVDGIVTPAPSEGGMKVYDIAVYFKDDDEPNWLICKVSCGNDVRAYTVIPEYSEEAIICLIVPRIPSVM